MGFLFLRDADRPPDRPSLPVKVCMLLVLGATTNRLATMGLRMIKLSLLFSPPPKKKVGFARQSGVVRDVSQCVWVGGYDTGGLSAALTVGENKTPVGALS